MRRIIELITPAAWDLVPKVNQREIQKVDTTRAVNELWNGECLHRLKDEVERSPQLIDVRLFVQSEIQRLKDMQLVKPGEEAAFKLKFIQCATAFFYRKEARTGLPLYLNVGERRYAALNFAPRPSWDEETESMVDSSKRRKRRIRVWLRRYHEQWQSLPRADIVESIHEVGWGDLLAPYT